MSDHKLVWVEWRDSCSGGGWRSAGEAPMVSLIRSIGWLVADTPTEVKLSAHFDPDHANSSYCDIMAIPKSCVVGYGEVVLKW